MTSHKFSEMVEALIVIARATGRSDATIQSQLAAAAWSLGEGLL
jgi:hypothetical protein